MATPEKLALVRRVGLMAQTGEIYIRETVSLIKICKRTYKIGYTQRIEAMIYPMNKRLWKTVISVYNRRWTRMDTANVEHETTSIRKFIYFSR